MKRYLILSLFFFVLSAQPLLAQEKLESGVIVKKLFLDYQGPNGGDVFDFQDWNSGFEIGYIGFLSDRWSIAVPLKVASVKPYESLKNTNIFSLDGQLQYHLLGRARKVNPYLSAGAGIVTENFDSSHIAIPVAFGANIRVGQKTDLNGELSYRFGGDDYKDNMQIGIGFIHRFGKISMEEVILPEEVKELDADGDGVPDDLDLCPQTPGLEAFFGCPDTDGDGIQDSMDECPEEPGSKELKGCPDTDKDGVSDKDDECPNVAGTLANKGCPESKDTDGDGIVDDKDACPNTAGVEQFNGCPDTDKDGLPDYQDDCPYTAGVISLNGCPDRDGDGVADKDDRCPDQAGRVSNFGCPDLKIEDREVLEFAVQAVEFDFGKATLRRSSFSILNKVADVIKRYPAYSLRISGHTDNVGDASRNQKLSEQRARSCYEYLNTKGVPTSRMNYIGYGEERPIEDNDTESGRARNRRVEFDVYVK